jgi:signal transduction histidine kinase
MTPPTTTDVRDPAGPLDPAGPPRARSGARRPRFTLAARFLGANLAILLVAGIVVGFWVGDTLERSIVDRTAAVTALYVESFVEPLVQPLEQDDGSLPAESRNALDELLRDGPLGDLVVSLRVWSPTGTIVYGSIDELVGQSFPVDGELAEAFKGSVAADLSDLASQENSVERRHWSRLLEMYVPVRLSGSDAITSVVEFYQLPDAIDREVGQARLTAWVMVAAVIGVSFLLLYGIVKQGSDTIGRQETVLERQVIELSALLAENSALSDKVRAAADRTLSLNEQALRRISADLHDGPGQTLSLALIRFDALRSVDGREAWPPPELDEIEDALRDALRDMRAIAAGLRMPELTALSVREVASRAVSDHTRRTGMGVEVAIEGVPDEAVLSTKIALFRAIAELLSNAYRHGQGSSVRLGLGSDGRWLHLSVADHGAGFDVGTLEGQAGLGLAGMREQAELLGGDFEVLSRPGSGTEVRVRWPLTRSRRPAGESAAMVALAGDAPLDTMPSAGPVL